MKTLTKKESEQKAILNEIYGAIDALSANELTFYQDQLNESRLLEVSPYSKESGEFKGNTLLGMHLNTLLGNDLNYLNYTRSSDLNICIKVMKQMEANGIDLEEAWMVGNISKAYYQVKLTEYSEF